MAVERSGVPSEQRIFSLVLALVASPEGALKSELLSSVYGYADRYRRGEVNTALDRQFERDKEQLRALGINIDTLDSPQEPGNNQLTRYRISKERLQVPRGMRFSERELVLLRLAALAWREGSMSSESRRATMKLESLGASLDVRHLGVAPRIAPQERAAAPLQRAIDASLAVRFSYEVPRRGEPLERSVAPLRLHRAEGRWHLIGWDLERQAGRVFLLSRIRGQVSVTRDAFAPSLFEQTDMIIADMLQLVSRQRAHLLVLQGSVAEARLLPRATNSETTSGQWRRIDIGTLDFVELAGELVGYGADARVVQPEELRELVIDKLGMVVQSHG